MKFTISFFPNATDANVVKTGPVVLEKMLTQDARLTKDEYGRKFIATGHLSNSGDRNTLWYFILLCSFLLDFARIVCIHCTNVKVFIKPNLILSCVIAQQCWGPSIYYWKMLFKHLKKSEHIKVFIKVNPTYLHVQAIYVRENRCNDQLCLTVWKKTFNVHTTWTFITPNVP